MLVHYILVRRDLPFGTTLAMVAHAAAESNYLKGHCTVVVLGVRSLAKLRKWEYKLKALDIPHLLVREPDMPWNGQCMAIGVMPDEKEKLGPIFTELNTYQNFEGPHEAAETKPLDSQGDDQTG